MKRITILAGETFTFALEFHSEYIIERLQSFKVFLGSHQIADSITPLNVTTTDNARIFLVKINSQVTYHNAGLYKITLELYETVRKLKKYEIFTLEISSSTTGHSDVTNDDFDTTVKLNPTGTSVTDVSFINIQKGLSSYEIALQNNAFVGTEAEFAEYQTGKNTRNFTNVTVPDGELFLHNMGSTRLSVAFYDLNGVEDEFITWQPYDSQYIRVHGGHSGDIYITKRNASTISLEGVEDGDLIEHTVASTKVYTEVYDENGILDRAVKIIPVDASHVRINLPGIELINDVLNRSYTGELYIVAR